MKASPAYSMQEQHFYITVPEPFCTPEGDCRTVLQGRTLEDRGLPKIVVSDDELYIK